MPDLPVDRRVAPRYHLVMDAEAIDLRTRSTLKLRCSDISLSGCYLDTLNPLEPKTPLWIRLVHGQRIFEAHSKVAYAVPRLGMGVTFTQPLPVEQLEILSEWLAQAGGSSGLQASLFGISASH
jgi:hypothetical protein